MRTLGFYLFLLPFLLVGLALTFDVKGFRTWYAQRPGDSAEFGKTFQPLVRVVGIVFLGIPLYIMIDYTARLIW
ncbi:hypothetical protein ABT160_37290 [Streptomyces sp. NPDC001941]|uniref:hypothetical protein n=1 Tax=Streptomyces sp. NPDC001941 TaxID=3154659 RepID=UPI00331D760E